MKNTNDKRKTKNTELKARVVLGVVCIVLGISGIHLTGEHPNGIDVLITPFAYLMCVLGCGWILGALIKAVIDDDVKKKQGKEKVGVLTLPNTRWRKEYERIVCTL